ncbi:MAG: adenosine kinase [Paludibacteraceae bacterium]|nr:adenosine kinase [Paludibacteraceae bacterium]
MKRILGIGNALVDILMLLRSDRALDQLSLPKGSMQLIDEKMLKKIQSETLLLDQHIATGGSAANTIISLAHLGVNVGFIGKIGNDSVGEFFNGDLFENGVLTYLAYSTLPSGRCHVLISPDSERTMCTYLGAAANLQAEDLKINMFKDFDILHIEGYLVSNKELLLTAARLAKKAKLKISIDLASYNVVEENLPFLLDFVEKYVDIVFANEEEAFAFTKLKNDEKAAQTIASLCDIAIVKVGQRGSFIHSKENKYRIPSVAVNCIDTTGAGDLYAAGFLYGLSHDLPLDQCGKIGTICAGHVIRFVGAKMDDRTWKIINEAANTFQK